MNEKMPNICVSTYAGSERNLNDVANENVVMRYAVTLYY